jgi:hypothetical protein
MKLLVLLILLRKRLHGKRIRITDGNLRKLILVGWIFARNARREKMKEIKKRVIIVSKEEIYKIVADYFGVKGKCEIISPGSIQNPFDISIVETIGETEVQVSGDNRQCESDHKSLQELRKIFSCKECANISSECDTWEICDHFVMKK